MPETLQPSPENYPNDPRDAIRYLQGFKEKWTEQTSDGSLQFVFPQKQNGHRYDLAQDDPIGKAGARAWGNLRETNEPAAVSIIYGWHSSKKHWNDILTIEPARKALERSTAVLVEADGIWTPGDPIPTMDSNPVGHQGRREYLQAEEEWLTQRNKLIIPADLGGVTGQGFEMRDQLEEMGHAASHYIVKYRKDQSQPELRREANIVSCAYQYFRGKLMVSQVGYFREELQKRSGQKPDLTLIVGCGHLGSIDTNFEEQGVQIKNHVVNPPAPEYETTRKASETGRLTPTQQQRLETFDYFVL